MRILILFIGFIRTCSTLDAVQEENISAPAPPLSNPNVNTEHDLPVMDPMEPVSAFKQLPSKKRTSAICNLDAITAASWDQLGGLVRDAPRQCVNGIFSFVGPNAVNTCNEDDMNAIAYYFYTAASSYDPLKPEVIPGILNFALYLRGCYVVRSNNVNVIANYSPNLVSSLRYGLNTFFARPNMDAQNDAHYEIMREVITLVSNMKEYVGFASVLAGLLTKVSSTWKFETPTSTQRSTQPDVTSAIFDNFFRSHDDEAIATAYYCKPQLEVAQSLSNFMDTHSDLVNTASSWILQNAAAELGRFAKYTCIYDTISTLLKKQLAKYSDTSAPKVYISMIQTWAFFDYKNCETFGFCNFMANLQQKILPFTKSCDKTFVDTFKIRAQQLNDTEFGIVCKRLKDQEAYFHKIVSDRWQPVNPDTNVQLEVVIFDNSDEYKFFVNKLFGIGTNNGGAYMEGDPTNPANIARYYCYKRPVNGQFDIWNLEHEFTHYLDHRYDMLGDDSGFGDYLKNGHMVWWLEGVPQYLGFKNDYPYAQQFCAIKGYPLSVIFTNTYTSGDDRVYHYGYLAARFMFTRHADVMDSMLGYFRYGQYKLYDDFMIGVGTKYDQEFSQWCDCIANNGPC